MTRIPPELEGEYIIRVMDMPDCLNGMVKYDENDFANIYINARLSPEGRRKAADHELTHVINDDIHNSDDIRTIEARADGLPAHLKPIPHLMRASDLLSRSKSLPQAAEPPVQRKVPPKGTEEVVPHSQIPHPAPHLSHHQTAVLLRAISDLDDWLFCDTTCEL